jgi:hypothetical protein
VPRFRCRLRVAPQGPITDDQISALRAQPHATATRREGHLWATVATDAGGPAGAIARAENTVLAIVPGDVTYAEATVIPTDQLATRRRRLRRRNRRGGRQA